MFRLKNSFGTDLCPINQVEYYFTGFVEIFSLRKFSVQTLDYQYYVFYHPEPDRL